MSTVEASSQWLGRLSDWANPILVKETRQALKSRQFVATFMLLLVAAWLITVFGVMLAGSQLEYGASGRGFFYCYYFALCVATQIIVPFGAFRSLLIERDLNTYELLSITSLTPRQIVWGKLLSALVQVFIFYSAIAPFVAFTALLEGFDFAQVTFLLVLALFVSLLASMTALMVSTLARQRHWQSLNSVFVLGGLAWWFMIYFFGIGGSVLQGTIAFDDPEFWWLAGTIFLAASSYFVLFQQITTAQLTFESDNRSSGIRVTCALQFWLLLTVPIVMGLYHSGSVSFGDDLLLIASLAACHWSIVGLMVSTEEDYLSRRVRRNLPRFAPLRLLVAPLMPGGSRGLLFTLLHVIALAGFLQVVAWLGLLSDPAKRQMYNEFVVALCGYVAFYIGLGAALARWGRALSADIRPAHARVLTVLLFLAGLVGPYIPSAVGLAKWSTFSVIYLPNPVATLMEIENSGGGQRGLVAAVALAAGMVVLVNLRAMLRGVSEVLFAPNTNQT